MKRCKVCGVEVGKNNMSLLCRVCHMRENNAKYQSKSKVSCTKCARLIFKNIGGMCRSCFKQHAETLRIPRNKCPLCGAEIDRRASNCRACMHKPEAKKRAHPILVAFSSLDNTPKRPRRELACEKCEFGGRCAASQSGWECLAHKFLKCQPYGPAACFEKRKEVI